MPAKFHWSPPHASRLVLSLRCASALPLPSFPTLHPKPVTLPTLVFFPQHRATEPLAHFLHPFSYPAIFPENIVFAASRHPTRLHEVSTGSLSPHSLPRPRHAIPRPLSSSPTRPSPDLTFWNRCHDARGRLGLEGPIAIQPGVRSAGITCIAASQGRQGCAFTPHRERGPSHEVSTAHSHRHQQM